MLLLHSPSIHTSSAKIQSLHRRPLDSALYVDLAAEPGIPHLNKHKRHRHRYRLLSSPSPHLRRIRSRNRITTCTSPSPSTICPTPHSQPRSRSHSPDHSCHTINGNIVVAVKEPFS